MKYPKDIHCGETFYHCISGICIKMHTFTEPYVKGGMWVWKARDRKGNIHPYAIPVDESHMYLYDVPIYGFSQDKLI